ncbi:hypothetical protein MNEG_5154 [Monoraphidium neglectum]|jgi:hypothetical protein|uniref:Uncharacterized protein n=1 Tax=Monoraphidium neglectum TaxID=145388 RepID=A0A0D2JVJ4_9CHLO|nr:hypothetical protein MNEG_5154 [Monoraphidium neglectum]KIZ02803.1 hypothetical protein MNEG_5154 [Monoraphidium neglectum]|eukprot:XP_013901822.1 hypothetical protein MNEG_5154 [Monoraphidium neglectum]
MTLPSLGPAVVAAPLVVRALAYTTLWATHQMAVLLLVWGLLLLLERVKLIKKNTKEPTESIWTMLAVNMEASVTHP